jgi:hypothetical protein
MTCAPWVGHVTKAVLGVRLQCDFGSHRRGTADQDRRRIGLASLFVVGNLQLLRRR